MRGFIAVAPLVACAIIFSGCWPFNRTPPQQKYFDALKMGNSAEASQLWLQMTPDQRAKFERGEGIRPSVTHNDVQQAIDEHYAEQEDDGSAPKPAELAPDAGGRVLCKAIGEPPTRRNPRRPAITRKYP